MAAKTERVIPVPMPMSMVIYAFEREYIEGVALEALSSRGNLSEGARSSLNSAIADGVRLDGFRDASKAAPGLLRDGVIDALQEPNDRLAASLFRAWVELREPLRERVADHLHAAGAPAEGPDLKERMFDAMWTWEQWRAQVDAVAGENGELDPNDVGLMLCYVSGMGVKIEDDEPVIESPLFEDWLSRLRDLPFDAVEWTEIEDFAQAVRRVAENKETEIAVGRLKALVESIERVREDFEPELRYLEIDMAPDARVTEVAESVSLALHTEELLDELYRRLAEYRAVRPQADSRTEEALRAVERQRCEEAVLSVVRPAGDEFASEKNPVDDDETPGEPGPQDRDAAGEAVPPEEYRVLRAEVDRLNSELELLRAENARLAEANDGLRVDRESLGGENDRMRDELSQSRDMEETWRRAYVSAMSGRAEDANGPEPPATVKEAVSLAEETFPDRLVFALNSKSAKRSPFQKPEEVFDALAWLATVYYQRRTRPGKLPGFDKLLKESCPGWSYKPKQTDVTKDQFEEWYTTTVNGKSYDLEAHLGKGTSFDPQNTLRIAFAWDDELNRVVVGYIGLHQRNRRS